MFTHPELCKTVQDEKEFVSSQSSEEGESEDMIPVSIESKPIQIIVVFVPPLIHSFQNTKVK